ncbi:hypothetical protein [Pontibaca salina]|uniref:Uncharacterized protein n=1 Tax=Pontibaca salina TaxID=2795731 RepID=A0A934M1G1_9RHOB|nr:hypothetical protein [Pontibaca salina]MBI6630763.1 hypothetical protein [Pontibaca salina]
MNKDSLLDKGRVILPVEYVDGLADGGTLVHEYVHTLQASRDDEGAHWLNEMVATAIGSAWVRKRTGQDEVYEPKYSMVLDREFWAENDNPGYLKTMLAAIANGHPQSCSDDLLPWNFVPSN